MCSEAAAQQSAPRRSQVAAIRREQLDGIGSPEMRDMLAGCIGLLSADIYSSRSRVLLELLQNADDNEFDLPDNEAP